MGFEGDAPDLISFLARVNVDCYQIYHPHQLVCSKWLIGLDLRLALVDWIGAEMEAMWRVKI